MTAVLAFAVAFVVSFIGSIPPGVLNLTVIQLGLDHKVRYAYRFAIAAALIEYPYAWAAIAFENILTRSPIIAGQLQLIASVILLVVGIYNLSISKQESTSTQRKGRGFRKGLLLAIMNPMALPFWLAITAYLRGFGWFSLTSNLEIHFYLAGVSLGAFMLLIGMAHLAKFATQFFSKSSLVKVIPGVVMIVLACYGVVSYFL